MVQIHHHYYSVFYLYRLFLTMYSNIITLNSTIELKLLLKISNYSLVMVSIILKSCTYCIRNNLLKRVQMQIKEWLWIFNPLQILAQPNSILNLELVRGIFLLVWSTNILAASDTKRITNISKNFYFWIIWPAKRKDITLFRVLIYE